MTRAPFSVADSENPHPVDATGDAGGDAELGDGQLDLIREELAVLAADTSRFVVGRRAAYADVLACRWAGQSFDGRKHAEDLDEEPFPFEGASDMRIRLADEAVRVRKAVALQVVGGVSIRAVAGDRQDLAVGLEALVNSMVQNRLVSSWRREWSKLFQYAFADTPGCAVMGVFWERPVRLVNRPVSVADLDAVTQDPAATQAVLFAAEDAPALALLAVAYPGAKPPALKKALKALRAGEEGRIAVPMPGKSRPVVRALRVFRDIFFPAGTLELQRARVIYRSEWITRAEVETRRLTDGWTGDFVDELLKHPGANFLPVTAEDLGITAGQRWGGYIDPARRNMYQVITAYYRAVNEDGVPAVYTVVFSGAVDIPARDREILDYPHGDYPFVWCGAEPSADSLWDTRGIPEIVATDQTALKLLNDSFNDHTTISTLPPIRMPANRPDMRAAIGPLQEWREYRPNETGFVNPPPYPATNDAHRKDIKARVAGYFGLRGEAPPELVALHEQSLADDIIPVVREVLLQMIALALGDMSPAEIAEATGDPSAAVLELAANGVEYDIALHFDARASSLDWVKEVGGVTAQLLGMDNRGEVDRNLLLRNLFGGLGPSFRNAVKPAQQVDQDEIKDETNNCSAIMTGAEPVMYPSGQNARLRLQVIQDFISPQRNPFMAARLAQAPDSRAIFTRRIEHFQGLIQQEQNAVTGRNQAEYALPAMAEKAAAAPGA